MGKTKKLKGGDWNDQFAGKGEGEDWGWGILRNRAGDSINKGDDLEMGS